jgi:hypothetical protein
MATHSPFLMAYPNARLLRLTKHGLEPITVKESDHFKTMREFFEDPRGSTPAQGCQDHAFLSSAIARLRQGFGGQGIARLTMLCIHRSRPGVS